MADTKISAGADPGTLVATDKLPLARSASTTTYAATMAEIASYANTAYTPNYSAAAPIMDGTAAPGVAAAVSRGDHIHPSDLTRAPLASPTFTGTPAAPTPTTGTNSTQIATTAFVQAQMVASGAGVSTWNTRAGAVVLQQVDVAAVGALHDDGRNLIDNGCFNVAQRGAGPWTADTNFTLDRWQLSISLDTVSVSQSAFNDTTRAQVGDEAATFLLGNTFTGNAGAGAFNRIMQRIEDVRRLAGKTVTVSLWAWAGSGTPKLGVGFVQNFGTGGSPSAAVAVAGQSVTLNTTATRYTLTFAVPSVSGKTLGTNGNHNTELSLWFSSGATQNVNAGNIGVQSGVIALWGVQLEIGSVVTPLDYGGTPQQQLAECQRFYQAGACSWWGYGPAAAPIGYTVLFPVRMRAAPSVIVATSGSYNLGAPSATSINPGAFDLQATPTAAGQAGLQATYTASADL